MARRVTFCSVSMALTVICLYGASALSIGRLAALGLSAVFCAACVDRFGVRYGVVVYVGSSILSLLLIPKRMYGLIYVLFVGYYPIVKLYIEKLNKRWAEWILKLLYFNLVLLLLYAVFRWFFLPNIESAWLLLAARYGGVILLGLEVLFVVCDVLLSYLLTYYRYVLRRLF